MSHFKQYLATCVLCGCSTTKTHARTHDGQCKFCVGQNKSIPTREQRIIDHGYQAYAREEGHYDQGDY